MPGTRSRQPRSGFPMAGTVVLVLVVVGAGAGVVMLKASAPQLPSRAPTRAPARPAPEVAVREQSKPETRAPDAPKTETKPAAPIHKPEPSQTLKSIIAEIESRCPSGLPDEVEPLPGADEIAKKSTPDLIGMLGHWNPAMRGAATGQLSTRGPEVLPDVTKALNSGDWRLQAGAATCIGSTIRTQMHNWKTAVPGETNYRVAHATIRGKYRHLAPKLIEMLKSEQRDVRAASMGALLAIGADAPGVALAILDLSGDPDLYIADQAMIQLEKNGGVASLDTKTRIAGLAKALEGELPRGRGHVMRMVLRLPVEERRQLVPAMLKNAAWSPTRDMMFSLAGRDASIKLLTEYRVKELIPLVPKIIQAKERGRDQIRAECFKALDAFGPDARAALPGLKDYLKKLDADHEDLQKLTRSRERDGWMKNNRAEHKLISDLVQKLSR